MFEFLSAFQWTASFAGPFILCGAIFILPIGAIGAIYQWQRNKAIKEGATEYQAKQQAEAFLFAIGWTVVIVSIPVLFLLGFILKALETIQR